MAKKKKKAGRSFADIIKLRIVRPGDDTRSLTLLLQKCFSPVAASGKKKTKWGD